jgi:MATE family multidrug resistance protein
MSASVRNPRACPPWVAELRATATLAWPLVLSNLAEVAMQTTDVAMMGWLGKDALAAGALGANRRARRLGAGGDPAVA